MKKNIIWGAGFQGGSQLINLGRKNVDFFVDSNKKRHGESFGGKKVVWSESINDWSNYTVYIPLPYESEIRDYLVKRTNCSNDDIRVYNGDIFFNRETLEEDYRRAWIELEKKQELLKNKIVYFSWNYSQKHGISSFFKTVSTKNPEIQLGVIGTDVWNLTAEAEETNGVPTVIAPISVAYNAFLVDTVEEITAPVSTTERKAIARLLAAYPQMELNCAVYQIQTIEKYVKHILEIVEPRYVFLVNSKAPQSIITSSLCEEMKIPMAYFHPGYFPQTYLIDPYGEMGRCMPNEKKEFYALPIEKIELERAQTYISQIRASGENRKIQAKNNLTSIKDRLDGHSKTILFLGQPDYDFAPYDEECKKYDSPMFSNPSEAAVYISDLCKKNGWNFIFKPHPLRIEREFKKKLNGRDIYVENGDINELIDVADLIVTVSSSTSITACVRKKATLMLGYNAISGKGCVYESCTINDIEIKMKEALEKGYLSSQEEEFTKFVAWSKKYYLYSTMIDEDDEGKKLTSIDMIGCFS